MTTMSSSGDAMSSWHSVRPWAPFLSLSVREVTSVSATMLLSSSLDQPDDPALASLGLEDDLDPEHGPHPNDVRSADQKPASVVADALAKGLSVNVNGSAWPRVFIRIEDTHDEAVIIIYGFMPGRQYDIELGLAHAGETSTLRRHVLTEQTDDSEDDTTEEPESPTLDNNSSDPHSTPSTSPSRTAPGTPPLPTSTNPSSDPAPAPIPQITLEDRLSQLQHSFSIVNSERDTLLTSLKSSRKDAQKAESALRSEIDTLKRTFEKNSATEVRSRQKLLALQEAVKRAQNATRDTEDLARQVEGEIPALKARQASLEKEHDSVKRLADTTRKEREDLEESDRKRLEAMRAELANLTNKLERLNSKKERMESTSVPDLEASVREVEVHIKESEEELVALEKEERNRAQLEEIYLPRTRHNSAGPVGRPSAGQRSMTEGNANLVWAPAGAARQQPTHQPKSQSLHAQGTQKQQPTNNGHTPSPPNALNTLAQRRASLKTSSSSNSNSTSNSSSMSSSPSVPNTVPPSASASTALPHTAPLPSSSTSSLNGASISASASASAPNIAISGGGAQTISASTSTLSSRAPAFEPSRSIGALKLTLPTHKPSSGNGTGASLSSPIAVGAGRPAKAASGVVQGQSSRGGR